MMRGIGVTLAVLGALASALSGALTPVQAQVPAQQRRVDSLAADSARRARPDSGRANQPLDSATARRMGLPTGPSRSFAPPDSVIQALLGRDGYRSTRYRSDSAALLVQDERMILLGEALTEREGSQLQADTIRYQRASCLLDASGDPQLFDHGQVMVGQGIRFNSCSRRGVVNQALTNFTEGSTVWFLRGNVSQDSSSKRIYAGSSDITSCDLPVPHYHFAAREVKWISHDVLVARPVVLYVSDVPILWLPFMFQDMRPGRRSGILIPQFGINDLVRPRRSYNRQVTNVGYYWAINDYMDATAKLDWYSNRYVDYGAVMGYKWLNRFLSGGLTWSNQHQVGGGSGTTFQWRHDQQFDAATNLHLDLNYSSSTRILQQNAIDPQLNTRQITSGLNFSKRLDWGTITIGGRRNQSINDRSVVQEFPTFSLSPVSIALGSNVTWSPGLSFTTTTSSHTPFGTRIQVRPDGGVDTIAQTTDSRTSLFSLETPLRFGSFNWQNSVQMTDELFKGRDSVGFRMPNAATPDSTDSITVSRVFASRFQTGIDWNTGINLPILFRGSWKLQPVLGIANATSRAPFAVRNRNTNGDFVVQGKRFQVGMSATPTFFAFFPGVGPLSRIRHSISPVFSFNYAPAAHVSEEFARALVAPGQAFSLRSDPTQSLTVSLSQAFEGKLRPAAGDTLGTTSRKIRLLSITTSGLTYDFERAKQPGQTGWVTQSVSNALLSELLPGFSLNLTHDLWRGAAGSDTAHFDPFLQSVSANFSVSSRTLCALGSIVGLCRGGTAASKNEPVPTSYVGNLGRRQPGAFSNVGRISAGQSRSFTASFNYTLSRSRPPELRDERYRNRASVPAVTVPAHLSTQNLGFSTAFSPTPFWSLSWSSQYNITDSKFESQVVQLDRDLHEWKAGFTFVRNPNGNFALSFVVYLTDLPELRLPYNQTTIEQP